MTPSLAQLAADPEVQAALAKIPRLAAPVTRVTFKCHPMPSHIRSRAMKASHARPEVKAKIGAITRARWSDPVYRAKAIAGRYGTNPGLRSHWADPIWREKQCARIAAGHARRRKELSK